jgi:hypothetical protein
MLSADLNFFARTIVLGEEPINQINKEYSNYSAVVAIEIYRNNYHGNLHDALAGAYPVIKQLVGDEFFRFLARKFIEQYPSRSANLHLYGEELANFVTSFEASKELVYLHDVAVLEWNCHSAYFMDEEAVLDINELAQVPPERYSDLVLHNHPSCFLVRSQYPIAAIWHAHQLGKSNDFNINLNSGSSNALVYRKDDVVLVSELAEADAIWLQYIQGGSPLGVATAETLHRFADFDLLNVLQQLVAKNVFSRFSLGDKS